MVSSQVRNDGVRVARLRGPNEVQQALSALGRRSKHAHRVIAVLRSNGGELPVARLVKAVGCKGDSPVRTLARRGALELTFESPAAVALRATPEIPAHRPAPLKR